MLGVRRSSVTVAADRLSSAGLIEYRRGRDNHQPRRSRGAILRVLSLDLG
jgi:DNA-binding MarR family transcriptional regulator